MLVASVWRSPAVAADGAADSNGGDALVLVLVSSLLPNAYHESNTSYHIVVPLDYAQRLPPVRRRLPAETTSTNDRCTYQYVDG